jgi:NAD(P)-dependent dehydrogenase (short-subunit alcohol dehydrogenase family)
MSTPFAIVTGTSSGIGAVLTRRLLAEGWAVLGVSRRSAEFDGPYTHLALDLADVQEAARHLEPAIAERLAQGWSRVGLVNNAAFGGRLGPFEHVSASELARVHAVNVALPSWLMGAVVRLTPADTPLRIVNVSSGAAVQAVPGLGPYCSSKAALRMAGQVLGAELASPVRRTPAPRDTAVLSYEPGVVETPMQRGARETPADQFPWVGLFLDFKARGVVVSPDLPAAEIAAFLSSGPGPTFSERRLGG